MPTDRHREDLDQSADALLRAYAASRESAAEISGSGLLQLLPQVYQELRRMAAGQLEHERTGHTLQPTALVHETYLRLLGQRAELQNRAHFLALAARMMRRILVTHARDRSRQKRGGGAEKVELSEALEVEEQKAASAAEVSEALGRLERVDPRQAQIAELRFFAGLSVEETAEVLTISPATVKREWKLARLWLRRALSGED